MACMPKVCKQLAPAAKKKKNKMIHLLLSYSITTVTESLKEEGGCDTFWMLLYSMLDYTDIGIFSYMFIIPSPCTATKYSYLMDTGDWRHSRMDTIEDLFLIMYMKNTRYSHLTRLTGSIDHCILLLMTIHSYNTSWYASTMVDVIGLLACVPVGKISVMGIGTCLIFTFKNVIVHSAYESLHMYMPHAE